MNKQAWRRHFANRSVQTYRRAWRHAYRVPFAVARAHLNADAISYRALLPRAARAHFAERAARCSLLCLYLRAQNARLFHFSLFRITNARLPPFAAAKPRAVYAALRSCSTCYAALLTTSTFACVRRGAGLPPTSAALLCHARTTPPFLTFLLYPSYSSTYHPPALRRIHQRRGAPRSARTGAVLALRHMATYCASAALCARAAARARDARGICVCRMFNACRRKTYLYAARTAAACLYHRFLGSSPAVFCRDRL